MRRLLLALSLALVATTSPAAPVPQESKTLFHFAEESWAVGTLQLAKPLTFRNGAVLVFPSQIVDLVWSPPGGKPHNLMLVLELGAQERDSPYLQERDRIFAPVRLLPENSYWRDNLPNTPRHQVAGGRRYVFRGDDIPEVRRVVADFMAAHDLKGMERWPREVQVVAGALTASNPVVREDAVRWFAVYPSLARDFPETALPPVKAYLEGKAPDTEKASLIASLAAAPVPAIKPVLAGLASRDDATAAAALAGLDLLGDKPSTADLLARSGAGSVPVQAWAAEALGRRAGTEDAALARATQILDDPAADLSVRTAAATGLGASGSPKVIEPLAKALGRGDDASRAAAMALAALGQPAANAALIATLKEKSGEAAIAAATAMGRNPNCPECVTALREQLEGHKDESVRHLIGVMLEVPLEHKH